MTYNLPPAVPAVKPRSIEVWLPGTAPPDIFHAYPDTYSVWQDTAGRLFISLNGEKDPTPYETYEWRMVSFIDAGGNVRFECWNVRYAAREKRLKGAKEHP